MASRTLLVFIDPIQESSYPVTESGYALVHRLWMNVQHQGDSLFIAYPNAEISEANGEIRCEAHRLIDFSRNPYEFYRCQTSDFCPNRDVGSSACHKETPSISLPLHQVDAIIWRQETGSDHERKWKLSCLQNLPHQPLLFLDPKLLLDPNYSSKVLPNQLAPEYCPRSLQTDGYVSPTEKIQAIHHFIHTELNEPETIMVKPLHGDNGIGIHVLGLDPRQQPPSTPLDTSATYQPLLAHLLETHQDLVIQEYIPSIRKVPGLLEHQYGEVRFLLINGRIPTRPDGQPFRFARRTPAPHCLKADSGVSEATLLTEAELKFLDKLGDQYVQLGILYGGGDLIRTPDPKRPFLFTDAARAVCGHLVVTGALNQNPYLVIDQVLATFESAYAHHRAAKVTQSTVHRRSISKSVA